MNIININIKKDRLWNFILVFLIIIMYYKISIPINFLLNYKLKIFMQTSIFISCFYLIAFLHSYNYILSFPPVIQNILNIGTYGSIGFISLVIYYIKIFGELIEYTTTQEKNMNTMQLNYLSDLLKKEKNTKDFRHDLLNHIICIDSLAIQNKTPEIHNYLLKLTQTINTTNKQLYNTGNDIFNAILNYYLNKLDSDVKISITGKITKETTLNSVEFCCVFSNLIQNAIEELLSFKNALRYLSIHIKQGQDFLQITIKNSKRYDNSQKFRFRNNQEDIIHGIGHQNIKKHLKSASGKLSITQSETDYTAIITLPIKKQL